MIVSECVEVLCFCVMAVWWGGDEMREGGRLWFGDAECRIG